MHNIWVWPYIEGIIFCKFDEELGPVVLCKSPSGILGGENSFFSLITHYLLPDSHFEDNTLSIIIDDRWRAVGVPIFIEGSHYLRNSFQFTVCIIVNDHSRDINKELYTRHIARIVGLGFKQLEEECGILHYYCVGIDNTEGELKKINKKSQNISPFPRDISEIIENVRYQLNSIQKVHLNFTHKNALSFKIRPPSYDFCINPEDVPYPMTKWSLNNIKYLGVDILFIQVLEQIDGKNTVFDISYLCSIPLYDVITCLKHLVFYHMIKIIDMFSIENKYRYIGANLGKEDIIYKYLCFECDNNGNVKTFTKKYYNYLVENNIKNIRKFVSIGVSKKKIARLHEYPIALYNFEPNSNQKKMTMICNGYNTLDYIQIRLGFSKKSDTVSYINNKLSENATIFWAYL
ncbi:hypothetical protein FG386_002494 [Cryptosporidium ryanae]|uniref:uncharacterized protein n=1 Tax=Cryptosporidium ryanae TaxID=515981 RepID=UPI00351A97E0|nr:hypothetical protein FG386_002494 [Cryptosporidium ryanae]